MMNYTFKALKCSNEDKVICGSFFMESDASIWWEALEREYTAKGEPITWNIFIDKFTQQFIPEYVQDAKSTKFSTFTQGSLIVV